MAKKTATFVATVTVSAPSIDLVEGALVKEEEGAYVLRVKKPRSSKYYVQAVPKSQIVSASFWVDDNTDMALLRLKPTKLPIDELTGTVEFSDGFITVTDEEGTVLVVASEFATVTAADEEEAPKKGKKAAKKAAPKKGKKAKDEEEDEEEEEDEDEDEEEEEGEDEEEEEDEDEEEEEAPKKGKGKKGGKTKKSKEEDEEDDDDWDE